tara:strand:+ start:895 stop:1176 length:282 start_codon:yes stop_codon:yes gene_type:complete
LRLAIFNTKNRGVSIMQLPLLNKPLTFGLIPKMNNPLNMLETIRYMMNYNLNKLNSISGSNPKESLLFENANTELRLYKNIYKKECKKRGIKL